jgi:peptidoglycan/xylan/chitin deacetylase (PgdA/CDA1 family)
MKKILSLITSNPLLFKYRPNGLYCFNYHRIGDAYNTQFDPNVFSCDEYLFEEHLKFYKSNFDIINIDELNSLKESKKKLNNRFALITFDDGYIDNFTLAYPLLKKHQVPAVFFIATDFIEKEIIPWWDEIAFLIKNSNQKTLQLENWKNSISLTSHFQDEHIKKVLQLIKLDSSKPMDEKIINLKTALNLKADYMPPHKDLFMSWGMLREMQDNGMTIGSQSCSHSIMSHLSLKEQKYEAVHSKKLLSEQMGKDIISFAYPVGGASAFTEVTEKVLEESCYTLGFSFIAGINRTINNHSYHLKRFSVAGNSSVEQLKKQINKATLKLL